MIELYDLGIPSKVEIDSATYITLPVENMAVETTLKFFNIEKGVDNNYGLSQNDASSIYSKPKEDQIGEFLKRLGLPNIDQPGLPNIIDKFIRAVTKALLFFAKQFIALKESVTGLLEPLKNPTKPSNVTIIKDIVSKLKGIIEDIKKFLTDTVNWVKETFLGPLGEISFPMPSFLFNIGEIIPAFPFPLPIPETKTSVDLISQFLPEDTSSSPVKIFDNLFSYKNPSNILLTNIYKNTPYLQNIDTTNLVISTFGERDYTDQELGSSELKKVNTFKSLATAPIKMIIELINALLSAVIGAISFRFDKVKELVKLMVPSVKSLQLLVGKLIDGFIPNASKMMSQVSDDLEIPNNIEDMEKLRKSIRDIEVGDLTYNGGDVDIENDLDQYEIEVQVILLKMDDVKNMIDDSLSNFFDESKIRTENINSIRSDINNKISKLSVPNTFESSEYNIEVNTLISTINNIDPKYDTNGNSINSTPNEDDISSFFDNSIIELKKLNNYKPTHSIDGNTTLYNFFFYYNGVEEFPIKSTEIEEYKSNITKFLKLEEVEGYFEKNNEKYINDLISRINDGIIFVKKLRYIKFITNKFLQESLPEFRSLLIDFREGLKYYSTNQWNTLFNFDFSEIENKYNEIDDFVKTNAFSYLSSSQSLNDVSSLILELHEKIPINLRNFITSDLDKESGNISPLFTKEEVNELIDIIDTFLSIDIVFNVLYIESDLGNITDVPDVNGFEEDIVISYLEQSMNLVEVNKIFIEKDKNPGIIDNGEYIDNSKRMTCENFLIDVSNSVNILLSMNNEQTKSDISKSIKNSVELEKKLAETPPNKELISNNVFQIKKLTMVLPELLFIIFKGIFDYALEGLPPIFK